MIELRLRCSPEQEEIIADHLFLGHELGVQPDERAWILANVRKVYPTAHIKSADLDVENAEWVVDVQE